MSFTLSLLLVFPCRIEPNWPGQKLTFAAHSEKWDTRNSLSGATNLDF